MLAWACNCRGSGGGVHHPRHRAICGCCVTPRDAFTTFIPVAELKRNCRLLREMLVMPEVEHQNFSLTGRLPAMAILNPRKLLLDYCNAVPCRWHALVDFQHDQLNAVRDHLDGRKLLGVCSTLSHGHVIMCEQRCLETVKIFRKYCMNIVRLKIAGAQQEVC